jgi:hypothetical protein
MKDVFDEKKKVRERWDKRGEEGREGAVMPIGASTRSTFCIREGIRPGPFKETICSGSCF